MHLFVRAVNFDIVPCSCPCRISRGSEKLDSHINPNAAACMDLFWKDKNINTERQFGQRRFSLILWPFVPPHYLRLDCG